VVEVYAARICGSELEGSKSQSPFRVPPLIMGHELSRIRLDTGAPVAINPLMRVSPFIDLVAGRGTATKTLLVR
jgi:threonine dehydrogenase-like Zn-dependent dehydrogenase